MSEHNVNRSNQTDQKDKMDQTDLTYTIGDGRYRLEPLSWQQNKWLAEHIFRDIDMQRLDYATVHDLLREKAPLFMAICLIDIGMSRSEHSRLSWKSISERAEMFAAELTGEEVVRFGPHFFYVCRASMAQTAMLLPGRIMQQQMEAAAAEMATQPPAPGAAGSNTVSSPSAEEMSPRSQPSSPSGGQPTASPTSSDVSNGIPSIEPSSVGSGSNSHG